MCEQRVEGDIKRINVSADFDAVDPNFVELQRSGERHAVHELCSQSMIFDGPYDECGPGITSLHVNFNFPLILVLRAVEVHALQLVGSLKQLGGNWIVLCYVSWLFLIRLP